MTETKQWPRVAGQTPITLPTEHGVLEIQLAQVGETPMLLLCSEFCVEVPLVRLHSACVFGESLGALDCDCGVQLEAAVKAVASEGGVITYAWEEGRGLGISAKLRAIALQQASSIDTAEAFARLGHEREPRRFENHIEALRLVHPTGPIRLASSNPAKIRALEAAGFEVLDRVNLPIPETPERLAYLAEKRAVLGHLE
jgi:GTP cyclohydrolase II